MYLDFPWNTTSPIYKYEGPRPIKGLSNQSNTLQFTLLSLKKTQSLPNPILLFFLHLNCNWRRYRWFANLKIIQGVLALTGYSRMSIRWFLMKLVFMIFVEMLQGASPCVYARVFSMACFRFNSMYTSGWTRCHIMHNNQICFKYKPQQSSTCLSK